MEPIVGLEDWFEGKGERVYGNSGLDELFIEPAVDEVEVDARAEESFEETEPISPEDVAAARVDANNVSSAAEKAEWFDAWAIPLAVAAASALDGLQGLSDSLAEAQQALNEDTETQAALRETIAWQEKMLGPSPPFARPAPDAVVGCLLCEVPGPANGTWDERTGAHVCLNCVTAVGVYKNLTLSGTASTTTTNWSGGITWTTPVYNVMASSSGDISVNASWTGTNSAAVTEEKPADEAPVIEESREAETATAEAPETVVPEATTSVAEPAAEASIPVEDIPSTDEPLPEQKHDEEFRVAIPEKFKEMLRESDAENLGYQLVSILTSSGVLYEGVVVIDCAEAILPEEINSEDIEVIEKTASPILEA